MYMGKLQPHGHDDGSMLPKPLITPVYAHAENPTATCKIFENYEKNY